MILTFDGLLKMIMWRNEVSADKAKKIEKVINNAEIPYLGQRGRRCKSDKRRED